ncbi:transposase [Patescibacteria group bacterium]|nr:transposase [Patescibacteria group bacterium]MBU1472896.1 transposase [Patescibacteria group bacterium]MBU2459797.1 transposase [Patescibacteria group bacterium]MBU2544818.1 transposase [Patescibacteria group bacterium]
MPARKTIFSAQSFYHIYNRGHNKKSIFLHYKDYSRYLKRLEEFLTKHNVTLLAYCLMPNHLHLLLRQNDNESVDKFVHRLHTAYSMYFNKKYERVGSVFQGRFKAKLIDSEEYLLHVSRYIHLNPLEIVHAQGPALNSLLAYPWSSLKEYANPSLPHVSNPEILLSYFASRNKPNTQANYLQFVNDQISITPNRLQEISEGKP